MGSEPCPKPPQHRCQRLSLQRSPQKPLDLLPRKLTPKRHPPQLPLPSKTFSAPPSNPDPVPPKKLISALEAQGITNKPAIKRSLKALLEKGVLVAATGTGLNGSIKINPEESARRKKAAAAKAAKAKKAAAAKKKKAAQAAKKKLL